MKEKIKKLAYLLTMIFIIVSCQSEPPSGNEIVFGDVIGKYEGECADYISSTSNLMNREEATLTVIASSVDLAGINTSCDRIEDQELSVKSASASKIVFEKTIGNAVITMTYIAVSDSIVIIHTKDGVEENLIFTGTRN